MSAESGVFLEFQKIARLRRGCVVTEKIDGTNAQVLIETANIPTAVIEGAASIPWIAEIGNLRLAAGSRSRFITPAADSFGFAAWVKAHAAELWALGPGRHFGEWWGSGIQRGYGLQKGEKRWSLFNVARWADERDREKFPRDRPACCSVVPVVYSGPFSTQAVDEALALLARSGSMAAPGFSRPEGVVIWHEAARTLFKVTLEKDEEPKGARAKEDR